MHSTNTRVILLRHGQSTYNALGLYQGSSDRPRLTDLGRQQAQQTGKFFKEIKFDAIYCSPLKRAQDTAIELLQAIDPTVVPNTIDIIPQLHETELPAWQGFPIQFIKEQFPEDYRTWKQRPHEFRMAIPPSEETPNSTNLTIDVATQEYCYPALDLYDRIHQFWQEILPRHIGQTILVISHGGTNRALISTALGISPAYYHCIEQSNCALSILSFTNGCLESGKLEAMNHTSHIGQTIPQSKDGLRLILIPAERENPELAQLFKDEAIDFSISGDLEKSHAITEQILQHHPAAVQFQVLNEDFPQLWQQTINAKNRLNANHSTTGLVVACDRVIKDFLAPIFNLQPDRLWHLHLYPGTATIIQYPNSEHPPILQVMNLGI